MPFRGIPPRYLLKISQSRANSAQAKCAAGWLQSMQDAQEVSMDRSRCFGAQTLRACPVPVFSSWCFALRWVAGIAPVNAQQCDGAQRDSARTTATTRPLVTASPRPSDLPPRVREDENHLPNSENGFDMTPARQNLPRMLTRVGSHPLGWPSNLKCEGAGYRGLTAAMRDRLAGLWPDCSMSA
jgi:hypothetical protein